MIRLFLAGLVAVVHAGFLGFGRQPHLGVTEIGALAVDAFFVLSGFLVARSYQRLQSFPRYAWHRALRILPGFWVCMLATAFLVAPLIALINGRSATSVLSGQDSAIGYLTANAALLMRQFGIAGAPAFAYLCLYATVRLPVPWESRWDLSYGLYVWHWPIGQCLGGRRSGRRSPAHRS